jgi:hypothetical protein
MSTNTERPPFFCWVKNMWGTLMPERWLEVPCRLSVPLNGESKEIYPAAYVLLSEEQMHLSLDELAKIYPSTRDAAPTEEIEVSFDEGHPHDPTE